MNRPWSDWMFRLFKRANGKKMTRAARAPRLGIESLEDRVVPATTITIQEAAGSLDGFLSATDGTINATDSLGVAGTLSRAALQGVGPGIQISITAENTIVFDTSLAAPIALQTMSGNSAQFVALNGNITFSDPADALSTAGGDLTYAVAGGSLTLGSLATNGGNISLISDSVEIAMGATVNAGTSATGSIVTVRPITDGIDIDLGTETVGELSLTDAELDRITARILRVGSATAGDISISAAVSLGTSNVPTLSLLTGDTTATAVSQAAPLTVSNLAVQSVGTVTLTDAGNSINSLAASVTGTAPNSLNYTDTSGFTIDTVDGVAGVSISTGNPGNRITLTGGGAITQAAGANVTGPQLQLLGTGPVTLNNTGNDVASLAAALTGAGSALSYTDADTLFVDTVNGTTGVSTTNGAVSINTVNGPLTVNNTAAATDVDAGTATVSLTAGDPDATDPDLTIAAGASVSGTGGVTLVGDNIIIGAGAAVNAGTATALLTPFANGTLIDLGGGDGTNTLGLTDTELDAVTAEVVRVGFANAGNISVTALITPGGTNQLELVTGASIIDNNSGFDITVPRLGLTAGTGIGVGGLGSLDTTVGNLEATTTTGGIVIIEFDGVVIGGVNATLTGLTVVTSGDIDIQSGFVNPGDLVLTDTDGTQTVTGGSTSGNVSLNALGATSNVTSTVNFDAISAPRGDVSVTAGQNISFGNGASFDNDVRANGTVTFIAGNDITLAGFADIASDDFGQNTGGGVVFNAGGDIEVLDTNGDDASVTAGGTAGADVTFTAGPDGFVRLTAGFSGAVSSSSGDVTVNADRVLIDADSGITANAGVVTIRQVSANWAIDLGSATDAAANTLELSDAELDRITTPTLRIGDPANTGSITVTAPISPANVTTLSLLTGGAIVDGSAAGVDLTVTSLALTAATGIGSADILETAVTNLAASNTTGGNVQVSNATATLNLTTVDGIDGVSNAGPGSVAVSNTGAINVLELVTATGGGNITLSTTGAGADITLSNDGAVRASGGNGDILLDTSGATSGGAIVVNSTTGIEIQAAGPTGDIALVARDAVTLASAAQIQAGNTAAGGNISVTANQGVPGGGADITLNGTASIQTRGNVTLSTDPDGVLTGTAQANIVMDPLSQIKGNGNTAADNTVATATLRADGDITVSSVIALASASLTAANNILDDAATADDTFVQAQNISLSAGNRIGGLTPIDPADVFTGNTATPNSDFRGAIDIDLEGGTLTAVSGNTVAPTGTGGNVQLRQVDDPLDAVDALSTSGLNLAGVVINAGNQLALISSGGNFLVNNGFTVPSNADALLATTGGFDVVISGSITNPGAAATTSLVASGTGADILGPAADGNADVVGTNLNLVTTGGVVGGGTPLEINVMRLDGDTTGGGSVAAGGDASIIDTLNGIAIGRFTAGTAGDFTLVSQGNITGGSSIIAVTPNNNVAEVVADVVTLTATGASTGTTGQIGQTGGVFFELDANLINATTNASNLWISEVGATGAALGSVSVGTTAGITAFLRAGNGAALTNDADALADVLAPTVNVSTGTGGGSFGTLANPIQIDAGVLVGNLANGGSAFVQDLLGSFLPGLVVQRLTTTAGDLGVSTVGAGADITLGNPSTTSAAIETAAGTATVSSSGSILSNATAGPLDVIAATLSASAAAGDIGIGLNFLSTDVDNLTATATGGVLVSNTGPLTIATGGVTGGLVNIGTSGPLTVGAAVAANTGVAVLTAAGAVAVNANVSGATGATVTATDAAGAGQDVTVAAGAVVSAGAGANVTIGAGDNLTVNGSITTSGAGVITLTLDAGAADAGVGSTATIAGPAALSSANPVQLVGGDDADTFNLAPQTNAAVNVVGNNPTTAPGDTLVLDLTGTTVLTGPVQGATSGTFTFTGRQAVTFSGIESAAAATVTIAATAGASESSPGQFTLTRVGDTSGALTVTYTVGGSATPGVDFQPLSGTVTFAAGSATAVITVTAIDDAAVEGSETVTVTLTAGVGYTLGAPITATLTIADNDAPPVAPAPTATYTGATIVGGFLVLFGPSGQVSAAFPVQPGSSVLFADFNGDGFGDVILFLPTGLVILDGLTGRVAALSADVTGDGRPDILIFSLTTGALTTIFTGTGQVISISA